eukprot:1147912-Pelagomonas_calceolata.AAC.4
MRGTADAPMRQAVAEVHVNCVVCMRANPARRLVGERSVASAPLLSPLHCARGAAGQQPHGAEVALEGQGAGLEEAGRARVGALGRNMVAPSACVPRRAWMLAWAVLAVPAEGLVAWAGNAGGQLMHETTG